MASPHVAGVAALIVSQGITNPGAVAAKIFQTAQPMACPSDLSIYAFFPSVSNGAPQTCDGGLGTTDSTDTASWMRSRPELAQTSSRTVPADRRETDV